MASRKEKAKKVKQLASKSLEPWIWDAACSIRGAEGAPKYKDYILPPIFTNRLCDVFDDEPRRIVDLEGLKKNDYNISPSRYIHTGEAETYRPIGEIVAELDAIETEPKETHKALREILDKIGI
jgi:type I restriction-modification system DNA methylase subunit